MGNKSKGLSIHVEPWRRDLYRYAHESVKERYPDMGWAEFLRWALDKCACEELGIDFPDPTRH